MTEEPSVRRRLSAGIVDTGLASLATFVVGITAVVRFDDVDRGAYALFFAAFLMGELIANEWVFTPAEVESVSVRRPKRLSLMPRSLKLGIGPCLAGSLASVVALAITLSYTPTDVAIGLTVTSAPLIVLSPIQNHIRRMLHIASRSTIAAGMSAVQLGVVLASVTLGTAVGVPLAWLPFGALTLANAVSVTIGLWVVREEMRQDAPKRLEFRQLSVRGIWFVVNGAASAIAGFAVAVAISWLAGPEDLGFAESARVVAQPLVVFASGLSAVLGPRVMQAGLERDAAISASVNRLYTRLLLAGAALYVLLVGPHWGLNPVVDLVPSAYVLTGLVAVTVLANAAASSILMQLQELAGAGREKALAAIAWMAAAFFVGGGLTAGFTGAFARPVGLTAAGATRFLLQRRALEQVYASS